MSVFTRTLVIVGLGVLRGVAHEVIPQPTRDSTARAPDSGQHAAILKKLAELGEEFDNLNENLSKKLDDLAGRQGHTPEAMPPMTLPERILDGTALADFTPSFLGFEMSSKYHDGPIFTFTIHQGLSIPIRRVLNKDTTFAYKLALSGAYHGAYDFDTERNHSGPVISRLQNPMVFIPMRFVWGDSLRHSIPLYLGWAHESNGQFIDNDTSKEFFSRMKTGSKGFDPQDFASMGWNYWWLRSGYEIRRPVKSWKRLEAAGATLELRYHVEQKSLFDRTNLEDTALFDGSRTSGGIKGYEGTRLSLWMKYGFGPCADIVLLGHFRTAEIGNGNFLEYPSYGILVAPTYYWGEDLRLPLYFGASKAYKHELAHYTRRMWSFHAGVMLSTISLSDTFKSKPSPRGNSLQQEKRR